MYSAFPEQTNVETAVMVRIFEPLRPCLPPKSLRRGCQHAASFLCTHTPTIADHKGQLHLIRSSSVDIEVDTLLKH